MILGALIWFSLTGAGLVTRIVALLRTRKNYRALAAMGDATAAGFAREFLFGEWLSVIAWLNLVVLGVLSVVIRRPVDDLLTGRDIVLDVYLVVVVVVFLLRNLVDNRTGKRIEAAAYHLRETGDGS